ncbi:hypothetical protein QZH41_003996 [Actinostola sp. cb2023]|nr:hypothetical protein QZH41_003996 [Actinostola sp. cb2023]
MITSHEGQNGNILRTYDHVVEISDEESPSNHLNEDGLCKETISGSTYPKRLKNEEDQHEKHQEEDELCKETNDRTLPHRGKLEEMFVSHVETDTRSATSSVLPLGALETTFSSQEKIDNAHQPTKEPESSDVTVPVVVQNGDVITTDVMVHGVVENEDITTKGYHADEEGIKIFSSSSPEDTEDKKTLKKQASLIVKKDQRKRSKSCMDLDDVPESMKPVKRTVSHPSIVARDLVQADKRLESLDTWKTSFPLPVPDYPSTTSYSLPTVRKPEKSDQVEVPPANGTSDFDVEYINVISEREEESETCSDSVPKSPGIPLPQLPQRDNEEGSFLTKELRSIGNDYQGQTVPPYSTNEDSSFPDKQNEDVVIITNYDQNSIDNVPPLPTVQDKVMTNTWHDSTRDNPKVTEGFLQQQNTKLVAEKRQTTSSWSTNEQQVDFTSIKLKPVTWKHYDHSQDLNFYTPSAPVTEDAADARKVLPSSLLTGQQSSEPITGQQSSKPITGQQSSKPITGQQSSEPITGQQSSKPITGQQSSKPITGQQSSKPITGQQSSKPIQQPAVNHAEPITVTVPSYTTKKQSVNYKIPRNNSESTANNQVDFRAFKLRPTPASIKQHIGFREELESSPSQPENVQENDSSNAEKRLEARSTTGFLDGKYRVLEKRPNATGVRLRDFVIKRVSTYERYPLTGGVHLREVSAYGRCTLTRGVRLREVSTYERCPLTGGVNLREVSTYERCPLTGRVRLREVSTYGRCPLTIGVRLREVSAYERCPLTGGVRLRKVSAYGRCPLTIVSAYEEVYAYERCPLTGGVNLREVSTYERCPLTGSVRLREVYAYERCPLTGGVNLREVSTYERCPLTGSVRLREVYAYERCPHTGGVRLREVSAYERCPLTGGVRLCPLTGGVHLREVSTYGRCPLTRGVRLRQVYTYERCPLTGGVHLREVSTYGKCTFTGGVNVKTM